MNKSSKPAKWVCIRFVTSNFSTKGAAILCVQVFARERVRACTASCSIVKHVHTPIVGRRLCPSKLCVPYRRGRISTYGFPLARWRSPGHFYRVLFDHFLVLSFSFIAFSLSFSLSLCPGFTFFPTSSLDRRFDRNTISVSLRIGGTRAQFSYQDQIGLWRDRTSRRAPKCKRLPISRVNAVLKRTRQI